MTARNPKEIEILWEGGKKLAACLEEVKRAVRAGVKTGDLDALAEKLIVKSGGRPSFKGYGANGAKNPFPASLCVSVNDEVVHGIPSGRELRPGDIVGHGVGAKVHEDPEIPNWGKAGAGPALAENMVVAIEPMVTEGSFEVYLSKDGWTWKTKDGSRAAHFEHTILVTKNGAEILTKC